MAEEWDVQICCMGAGYVGGPTMAVIAKNCPKVRSSEYRRFVFHSFPLIYDAASWQSEVSRSGISLAFSLHVSSSQTMI
jgi:UDP-glucose/GDP-mannose dehydrogenase family, NAD binding domain